MIDQIKIGGFLRDLRKEQNKTQEEIAEKFGVSSRSVSRWENGTTLPDLSILVDLADYYDVDIREIIDGERKQNTMNDETKDTLKKVADYAENDKKRSVKRRTIVVFVGTLAFALGIWSGLAQVFAADGLQVDRIFGAIAIVGLAILWGIVIRERIRMRKKQP